MNAASTNNAQKEQSGQTNTGSEFAVFETGGKQYKVSVGDVVDIEKLDGEYAEGDTITFDNVLCVDNGKDTTLGDPYIAKASVQATLQKQGRGRKINVVQFRAKSRHFTQQGHRQPYMRVKIEKIS